MDSSKVWLGSSSPAVIGKLKWQFCVKTFSMGLVLVAIKAAGGETRVTGRQGVLCFGLLLVLLREVDVIKRGTGLGVSFNGPALVGLPRSFT